MEGITTYLFRNAYHTHFDGADKYFTPFLSNRNMTRRDEYEILPEHNCGMTVIPQILTNRAEEFLEIARRVADLGYDTVNLNLGCPSGTVVAKKRGAGLLTDPASLDRFLDQMSASHLDQNKNRNFPSVRMGRSVTYLSEIPDRRIDHSSSSAAGVLQRLAALRCVPARRGNACRYSYPAVLQWRYHLRLRKLCRTSFRG